MNSPIDQKAQPTANEHECLERWMREITDALVYQPEVPMEHKKSIVEAFAQYRKAIGKPLRS